MYVSMCVLFCVPAALNIDATQRERIVHTNYKAVHPKECLLKWLTQPYSTVI